jgi:murein L,D-transpeptidase YafK
VLRSYHIALGLMPDGPKERAGDFRTPEGRYLLARRNPRSDYFLSIQVSYPNDDDRRRAHRYGWDPGGSIMIHGQPNMLRHSPDYYATRDWTDGCIAISNSDMVELWLMTADSTPIEIAP